MLPHLNEGKTCDLVNLTRKVKFSKEYLNCNEIRESTMRITYIGSFRTRDKSS